MKLLIHTVVTFMLMWGSVSHAAPPLTHEQSMMWASVHARLPFLFKGKVCAVAVDQPAYSGSSRTNAVYHFDEHGRTLKMDFVFPSNTQSSVATYHSDTEGVVDGRKVTFAKNLISKGGRDLARFSADGVTLGRTRFTFKDGRLTAMSSGKVALTWSADGLVGTGSDVIMTLAALDPRGNPTEFTITRGGKAVTHHLLYQYCDAGVKGDKTAVTPEAKLVEAVSPVTREQFLQWVAFAHLSLPFVPKGDICMMSYDNAGLADFDDLGRLVFLFGPEQKSVRYDSAFSGQYGDKVFVLSKNQFRTDQLRVRFGENMEQTTGYRRRVYHTDDKGRLVKVVNSGYDTVITWVSDDSWTRPRRTYTIESRDAKGNPTLIKKVEGKRVSTSMIRYRYCSETKQRSGRERVAVVAILVNG